MDDRAPLQALVQRLSRPIEFASRDRYAHVTAVKDLGPYVGRQIVEALAARVYLPQVESELLMLRQLFADFESLRPDERKGRLAAGLDILHRLCNPAPSRHRSATGSSAGKPHNTPRLSPVDLAGMPIQYAKGVGPKRGMLLERLGIRTVEDALWCLPWRYEDRSRVTTIANVMPGREVTVSGVVTRVTVKRPARRRLTIIEVTVDDGTGRLRAVFFNQAYLEQVLIASKNVMLTGPVKGGPRGWTDLQMDPVDYEVVDGQDEPIHVGRIVPIYHETRGLTSRYLRALIKALLDEHADGIGDVLPDSLRERLKLLPLSRALQDVHFPPASADPDALARGTTPAHRRLAFEEFFILELALGLRHETVKRDRRGIHFNVRTPLLDRLRRQLPFALTHAQERVLREIQRDMAAPQPMNRLLQGDVGCGKTVIALAAMVMACGSGYQAALMAPTEILAEQHFLGLQVVLEALGLRAAVLTGSTRSRQRADARRRLAAGELDIAIGTHALLQQDVQFAKLGLVVIDEQHKFGVLQRKGLLDKGAHPDVLVVTATPIPRTLAMTVYGDLDLSTIDALPPGRRAIRTGLFPESQRRRAFQVLTDELRAGRQAYIVFPLVEESEKTDLQAAIQAAARLQDSELKEWRVGLLHGRLKAREKEATMAAFKNGDIHVLVATTVIEVGVDVPNATVMLIEHAERFGLAQLHQLRGRVGRGAHQSYCLLIAAPGGTRDDPGSARRRLDALVASSDGFRLAEEDLKLRGPGELFGVRQWGLPEFRAANVIRDAGLLETARREALTLLRGDADLRRPEHEPLRATVMRRWQAKLELGTVS